MLFSFPNFEAVCCSISGSNYCFLTCKRFLRRKVKWFGIPISLRIFHSLLYYTIKGVSIINEAEVDVFLQFSFFLYDPTNVGNLIFSSALSKPLLHMWGSSCFMQCWSLSWRILSINFLASEMSTAVWYFEHSLTLLFFETGMKTDLYQLCGHCWVFQICWRIECSTLTVTSHRI